MDYKKLIKALKCDGYGISQDMDGCSNRRCKYRDTDGACNIVSICLDASKAISDLLERAEAAEAKERGLQEAIIFITRRTEKAEKIASDLCDDFTDFVTSGIHNAAPYCANRRPECVDGWGWCNVDMKTCLGFYPEAAKKEELA